METGNMDAGFCVFQQPSAMEANDMAKFVVKSGAFRVILVADEAYEAATEAVRWWGETAMDALRDSSMESLFVRQGQRLGHEIRVSSQEPGARTQRFSTFSVVAHVKQESVETAWEKLLREAASNN